MDLDYCVKKVVSYMDVKGINSINQNDLKDILKLIFPQNFGNCYKLMKKEYKTIDKIVKTVNNKYSQQTKHYSAEERSNSNGIENTYYEKEEFANDKKGDYVEKELEFEPSENNLQTKKGVENQEQPPGFFEYPDGSFFIGIWIVLGLIGIYILFKIIRLLVSFLYDVFNSGRIVYMKVTLPRLDSKQDREEQKDIAKDMKEQIGRMAQVFRGIHKFGSLSVVDNVLYWMFDKAKIDLIYKYKEGELSFLVGTYPEYQRTLESQISAQYPHSVIQTIDNFNMLGRKKKIDILPLNRVKSSVFPIRTFKQLEDDPINNVLDAISKVAIEDEFTILLTLRPDAKNFNKKAKNVADKLYRRAIKYDKSFNVLDIILKPIDFVINGASDKMVKKMNRNSEFGDSYTRMTKAEEEAINTMAEEAGKPAFSTSMFLISGSSDKKRNEENIQSLVSAYTIYKDEYNNGLDQPEVLADIFGWIFKPIWKFSAIFSLVAFFTKNNILTVNEISSLFHFPDGVFNRSSAITRCEYKMTEPPKNLPIPKEENGRIITGIIAESYKGGKIPKIFEDSNHPNIGEKEIEDTIKDKKTGEEKTVVKKQKGLKIYKDAILLGISSYKNQYKPVYMKRKDRTRHHYIIGKSGGGKSVYIGSLARQDIWNGDGVCVIDPHGDLVDDIINYVPKERAKDIIYFDAGNEQRPMGLNLYEINNSDEADRVVNDATEIFMKMFGPEIFGPRIQEYFKYASLTLLEDMEEGATLLDVPRLFTDESYREYKIPKVKNPTVRNFWEKTYNAMGDREKQEIIPYFTSKFVSFNTNSLIRNIIGQTKSAFNFRKAMDSKKIILINLSKGKIGELNAKLLGMILVSQIYNAAMSRADTPEDERKDFYLYVDEFQNFVTDTFADILSEARKYKLSLIMAHQYIGQLESGSGNNLGESGDGVKDAVFGNAGTIQSFKVGASDGEVLEKEYSPVLNQQDIIGISNFKTYLKLNINNASSRAFNVSTIYTQDYENKKVGEVLKEYSSKKYGRDVKFVNEEIVARLGFASEEENLKV